MWLSIIIISLVGSILHFTYSLSNNNKYFALFSAVNESTWEHMKLAITPMLLWGIYDGYVYGLNPNYFIAKSLSIIATIIAIPVIFYGYMYITKKSILLIDISLFIISIIIGQYLFYYLISLNSLGFKLNFIGAILLFIIFTIYLISTFLPFKNFLFKDPITKTYGIKE